MSDLLGRLKNGEILICDGAGGTELQKKGLKPGECPEGWNVIHPEVVQEIHRSYLEADCNIILTNTFGGNRLKLRTCGREDKVKEFNLAGAKNAHNAVEMFRRTTHPPHSGRDLAPMSIGVGDARCTTIYILGDIGPTGQIMESSGGILTFEEAIDVFQKQIEFLFGGVIKGYVSGIIFETFEDIEEIKAGIMAAKNIQRAANIVFPIIASMTFHPGVRGFRTIMGTNVETAVKELEKAGADIIGTNCGNGPEAVVEIIKEMRQHTSLPLLAEPNAGVPILKDGKTFFLLGPEDFVKYIPQLIESGANIIGGCCGTTSQHIKKIAEIVHSASIISQNSKFKSQI